MAAPIFTSAVCFTAQVLCTMLNDKILLACHGQPVVLTEAKGKWKDLNPVHPQEEYLLRCFFNCFSLD